MKKQFVINFLALCTSLIFKSYGQDSKPVSTFNLSYQYAIQVTKDNRYMYSGGIGGKLYKYDIENGKLVYSVQADKTIRCITLSPDGSRIMTGGEERRMKLWDANTGRLIRTFKKQSGSILNVAFSADGNYAASGSDHEGFMLVNKLLCYWNINTGKRLDRMKGCKYTVRNLTINQEGKVVCITGSGFKTFYPFTGAFYRAMDVSGLDAAFHPNGRYATHLQYTSEGGSYLYEAVMVDLEHAKIVKRFKSQSSITNMAFSPDGKYFITAEKAGIVKIWDIEQGNCIKTLSGFDNLWAASLSAQSKYLLVSDPKTIRIFNFDAASDTHMQTSPSDIKTEISQESQGKKASIPPILSLSQLKLIDENSNNAIEANEKCYISFTLSNTGKGEAMGMKAYISSLARINGLNFSPETVLESIKPGESRNYRLPLQAGMDLQGGTANLKLQFYEPLGFQPDPVELKFTTVEFARPEIALADYSFTSDNGTIKLGAPIKLTILLQNKGAGDAEDIKLNFSYPATNVFPTGSENFSVGRLASGASGKYEFEFMPNKNYASPEIPITVSISEKYNMFGFKKVVSATINASSGTQVYAPEAGITGGAKRPDIVNVSLSSDVDKNIPENPRHPNRFALIIGNEDYQSHQSGLSSEQNVAFAQRDASIFRDYVIKTLGVEEANCQLITNADNAEMGQKLSLIQKLASKYGSDAELLIYYAGHGFPDEKTKEPYLIPVNVSGANLAYGIKLNELYNQLASLDIARVTVILDACFSGGGRSGSLLADRAIRINPAGSTLNGKLVVLAATSADQVALPYRGQQHGMFTYFLLKKLQESKGDISYRELATYLNKAVSMESLRVNQKDQEPTILYSTEAAAQIEKWKLK